MEAKCVRKPRACCSKQNKCCTALKKLCKSKVEVAIGSPLAKSCRSMTTRSLQIRRLREAPPTKSNQYQCTRTVMVAYRMFPKDVLTRFASTTNASTVPRCFNQREKKPRRRLDRGRFEWHNIQRCLVTGIGTCNVICCVQSSSAGV